MFYGRREGIAVVSWARVYALLCVPFPHRWFPIGKGRELCIRCGAVR